MRARLNRLGGLEQGYTRHVRATQAFDADDFSPFTGSAAGGAAVARPLMKLLAAHRAGLTTVLLAKRNEAELEELPDDVRQAMTFVPVEMIDEVLHTALQGKRSRSRSWCARTPVRGFLSKTYS